MDRLSRSTRMSNFMKIRPVRAELFHADGRDGANATKTGMF